MSRRHTGWMAVAVAAAAAFAAAGIPPPQNVQTRLSYDVHFLASPVLEGRYTGSEGAKVASDFIADRFRALGLKPEGDGGSYFQHFSFIARVHPGPGNALVFDLPGGKRVAKPDEDFRPLSFSTSGNASGEVVFAGYGIHAPDLGYDDYAGLDVKGKVVLVLRFSPEGDDPSSKFQPHMALRRKASEARELGAAALLVATGPVGSTQTAPVKISFDASFADSGLPVLGISTPLAEALFAGHGFSLADLQRRMNERREPASRPLGVTATLTADVVQERADARNVVALLPGTDARLTHQVVVIGAHFDHLGWGGEGSGSLEPKVHAVHPGADDNASGTAGMLEIAREMAAAPPERTLLFVAFSGEEEGLLGSTHFVQHPTIPKDDIVAMINLDMVGRPKAGPALTIGGYGTAAQWPELIEKLNAIRHFKISTSKGGFGASDHSSFYAADIPVLFLFTGAHEDYHKPTDTADRINYPGMTKVVGFAADLTRRVADLPARPTFQKVADEGVGEERRAFKVRTGVIPDFGFDGPGFKLSGVSGGSPADKAGLQAGDIVVRFGTREIRNIYDYMYALGDHKAGETVVLTVKRGKQTLELPVTLAPGGARGQ
jgi:aminopeptidase YwaD